jgi:chloride channel protein, CIC family
MRNYKLYSFKLFHNILSNIQKFLNRVALPDYTLFSIFALVTGLVAGLGAVLFHETIEFFSTLFFNHSNKQLFFFEGAFFIALPAIGMLIQSLMIKASPETAQKKGVSDVIKAVAMRGGYIRLRTTIFHFLAPAICISTGGTLGPEGPAAQIGGGIASKVGQIFGFSDVRRRIFTAAGAGAAISAVFNTPLGGIFFALEIILLNDFHSTTFSALILASITASVITRTFLGDTPTFHFDSISIGPYDQLYLYAILGILAGLLSLLFIRYSDILDDLFQRKILKIFPQWLVMVIAGLIVGICGYFYNDIFGIGYFAINKIIVSEITWQVVGILLLMKFLLVPMIVHSGGFGGLFAPSLFIGACFGYLFAIFANSVLGLQIDTTTFVLVSMGAVLGGINSIPISAILIIFEMTRDYTFILPLMLAVVISTTIVRLILKGSIHEKHLKRQGFEITRGRESSYLRSIIVKDVLKKDIILIPEDTLLSNIIGNYIESAHGTFYTIDEKNNISGAIAERELRPIFTEYETLQKMLVASDVARTEIITVKDSDNLDHVLKLFGKTMVNEFPVISSQKANKIVGTIWRQDVIAAYNKESLKHNLTEGLIRQLKSPESSSTSKIANGYSMIECHPPKKFIGKSLSQLRLRNTHGLEVIMIRKPQTEYDNKEEQEINMPHPEYPIEKDDILVLFGNNENVKKFNDWK